MKSRSKQPDLTFGTLLACTEILFPGQNPIQPWILTRAPVPRNTFQNDSFRSKRISFPSLPKHWCRLAHTRCRQVTTIGGGWGPAMSSIATILPGTPEWTELWQPGTRGGTWVTDKAILWWEIQRRDDHGHNYMARWFFKLNLRSYTEGTNKHNNALRNNDFHRSKIENKTGSAFAVTFGVSLGLRKHCKVQFKFENVS